MFFVLISRVLLTIFIRRNQYPAFIGMWAVPMCCYGDRVTNGGVKCQTTALLISCSRPWQWVPVLWFTAHLRHLHHPRQSRLFYFSPINLDVKPWKREHQKYLWNVVLLELEILSGARKINCKQWWSLVCCLFNKSTTIFYGLLLSTIEMTSKCSKLKCNHLQASGFTAKFRSRFGSNCFLQ